MAHHHKKSDRTSHHPRKFMMYHNKTRLQAWNFLVDHESHIQCPYCKGETAVWEESEKVWRNLITKMVNHLLLPYLWYTRWLPLITGVATNETQQRTAPWVICSWSSSTLIWQKQTRTGSSCRANKQLINSIFGIFLTPLERLCPKFAHSYICPPAHQSPVIFSRK